MRLAGCGACVALLSAAAAAEPMAPSLFADLRERQYPQVRDFILAAAEVMPAEVYGERPSPSSPSFAQEIARTVILNSRLCRALSFGADEIPPEYVHLDKVGSKRTLVMALQQTFAHCDVVFAALDERGANQVISAQRGSMTRGGYLAAVVAQTNQQYGKVSVHLRLKGLVPPSGADRSGP